MTLQRPLSPTRPPNALRRFLQHLWEGRLAYLFILPTFLLLGVFYLYPVYTAFTGAFTDWDGFNPPRFVGLRNFITALTDPVMGTAVRNNVWMAFAALILAILPPLLVAELIFNLKSQKAQYVYRSLFIVPLVVPSVVFTLLWAYFYRSDGPINEMLRFVGLSHHTHAWLSDIHTALPALIFMGFPWVSPFNLLILYAALQSIPGEIFEAGKLDGCTGWRRIWHIDLPLLKPQVWLLLIGGFLGSTQNIVAPLVMTGGGPGKSTTLPALEMYKAAVEQGQFGYSMALSLLIFLATVLIGMAVQGLQKRYSQ